jgi:hypothetical protein
VNTAPENGGIAVDLATELFNANAQIARLTEQVRVAREGLSEIGDLAAVTVVGGDDFDRGVRAARLDASDTARETLTRMEKNDD